MFGCIGAVFFTVPPIPSDASIVVVPATPSLMARATTSSIKSDGNLCCLLFTYIGSVLGLSSFSSFDAAIFNLLSLYSSSFFQFINIFYQ